MIHIVADLLLAAALLFAPGLLLARVGGVRGWGAVSAAVPLSCAVIGTAELIAAAVGRAWVPWGWAVAATSTAAAACVLAVARSLRRGDRPSRRRPKNRRLGRSLRRGDRPGVRQRPGTRRIDLRVLAGAATACLLLAAGMLAGTGSMSAPAQAFDIVFHLNAVQAIRQGGNASSLGGVAALYQGTPVYYPTVWHGTVALLPAGAALASNAMVLVVGALAWPLGVAGLLVETLDGGEPSRPDPRRRTAAALGTVLSAATVGVPTVLLGTLAVWPYALSVTCLPGVLVLALRLLRALPAGATDATDTADDGERERTASAPGPLAGTLLLVGAAGGAVLAHGAEAFNLMVLLVPLAAVLIARAVRAGGRRRRTALASLTAVAVVVLAGAWIMREALAGVLGYDRPGGSLPGTLGQALLDLPQYGPLASHGLPVGVVVCALAVVAAARVPRARPWLAAAALALCLVVVVGGPQWWGRQLGGPWYLQKARVQPLLIVPALVLAATGLDHLLRVRPGRRTLAVLTALVCAAAVGRLPLQADLVRSVHDADRIAYGTLVTPEEADFYASLGDRLPEDAVVVGAPSRGASYLLSLGGVDVVYPLRSDPTTGSAADLLAERAPDLRPGSTTCELLDEVGAEYYLRVDRAGTVWEERQAPVRWDRLVADWPTDGMEPVVSTGTASLWRITACGS